MYLKVNGQILRICKVCNKPIEEEANATRLLTEEGIMQNGYVTSKNSSGSFFHKNCFDQHVELTINL